MSEEIKKVETIETVEPTYPAPEDKKTELRRKLNEIYGSRSPYHPDFR